MYCTNCGKKLEDSAKFCSGCGKSTITDAAKNEKTPPAAGKNTRFIKWGVGILAVCICVFLVSKGIEAAADHGSSGGTSAGHSSSGSSGKKESLFSDLEDYELDGLLFRVPDDIEWEWESIYDDEIMLQAADFDVDAVVYDAKDLKTCDVEDEEGFVDFIVWAYKQNRGEYKTPVVRTCSAGHYVVIEAEDCSSVIGIYMDGDQGWVVCVNVYDPDEFEDYRSLAEFIASSGIIKH